MESLTRDEIETVRINIGAAKEQLMNQRRYNEAKEYEVIEDKLLAMLETGPSAEPSYEAVMSYCEKRNLALIDCGELHVLYKAWTQMPERKKGRWREDVAYYDEEGCPCIVTRCDQCGEPGAGNYCSYCGARMETEKGGEK